MIKERKSFSSKYPFRANYSYIHTRCNLVVHLVVVFFVVRRIPFCAIEIRTHVRVRSRAIVPIELRDWNTYSCSSSINCSRTDRVRHSSSTNNRHLSSVNPHTVPNRYSVYHQTRKQNVPVQNVPTITSPSREHDIRNDRIARECRDDTRINVSNQNRCEIERRAWSCPTCRDKIDANLNAVSDVDQKRDENCCAEAKIETVKSSLYWNRLWSCEYVAYCVELRSTSDIDASCT